jgi:hypothetical protein
MARTRTEKQGRSTSRLKDMGTPVNGPPPTLADSSRAMWYSQLDRQCAAVVIERPAGQFTREFLRRAGAATPRLRAPQPKAKILTKMTAAVVNTHWRANTTTPFAGITTLAEAGKPCSGPPDAETPPPLPATTGLTKLSYTSLLNTSTHHPGKGNPIS